MCWWLQCLHYFSPRAAVATEGAYHYQCMTMELWNLRKKGFENIEKHYRNPIMRACKPFHTSTVILIYTCHTQNSFHISISRSIEYFFLTI